VEIRDYLRIMRRHWLVIVAMTMATVALAAVFTFLQTPQYSSSAQLFISTPGSDTAEAYTGGLFSQQRVTSYADLADSRQVASEVADEIGLDVDPIELAERVTATAVPETVILEITVTDPDPEMAQELAQTYATTLTNFVAELENPPGDRQAPIKASIAEAAQLPM
jgi:capsular polysaccharide biosynthesis protein